MRFQGCLYSSICVPYSICASNAYSICKDQFEYLSEDQFEQVDKENTIYLEIDFHFNVFIQGSAISMMFTVWKEASKGDKIHCNKVLL